MPLTISNTEGDGLVDTRVDYALELPDSGSTIVLNGTVQGAGGPQFAMSPTSLVMPNPPASGTIFWNLQADTTSGAVTVQQSTVADPSPINTNNVVIFRQQLVAANTDPALNATDATPDSAAGQP